MKTPYDTTEEQKKELPQIKMKMKLEGISDQFISDVMEIANEYGGVYDLLNYWVEEQDVREKILLMIDIKKNIDDIYKHTRED